MTASTESTPQHTPPRDQVALDWQRILHAANEDLQTTWGFANDGDPAMQSEADDLEAALDRSGLEIERRVYSHAALVEALEAVHARRIAWPKEIEEKVTAALAAAKGTP